MAFEITVNKTSKFTLGSPDLNEIDLFSSGDKEANIRLNNKNYRCKILEDSGHKRKTVSVNGNTYSVEIANDLDQLIKEMGLNEIKHQSAGNVFSPMPGLVIEVLVNKDQVVAKDEPLLILEAMKMENVIMAPSEGKVESIKIAKEDKVEKSQLLVVLSPL